MRLANPDTNSDQVPFQSLQLLPSDAGKQCIPYAFSDNPNRFIHVKKLIHMFSQKLMHFLHATHEPSLTSWMTKDEKGQWLVGPLQMTEGAYPPHVIALRDLIRFLNSIGENLDLLNQLLTHSHNGINGIGDFIFEQSVAPMDAKLQKLLVNWANLQESIGAIKQLPIHNGIIDAALYLHERISKYFQGDKDKTDDHLLKVIQVIKDALDSSELLQLKQNDELLAGITPIKAQLELDYWKILLATSKSQQTAALDHAEGLNKTTPDEHAIFAKIKKFADNPAWNVQRLAFLEQTQQSLVAQQGLDESRLTSEKLWLYLMQLKSIISQVIIVTPEFMAEDNDAGNMLRMIGTLERLPTDMIKKINHQWFIQVMKWLRANYSELCKEENLKKLAESVYNIHTNLVADRDELEVQFGLKLGLFTRDIPQEPEEPKPVRVILSGNDAGPTETCLREQAVVWKKYVEQQDFFCVEQRIARLIYQKHSLNEKKKVMEGLLEEACLQKISHLYTLNAKEALVLKNKLIAIAQEVPALSSLGQYIKKKLLEIEAQIGRSEWYESHRLGSVLTVNSGARIYAERYVPWLNSSASEKRAIEAAIQATEKEFQVSLTREQEYANIAWDTYWASTQQLNYSEIMKELEENTKLFTTLREKFTASLEDTRAQEAAEQDRKHLEQRIAECKQKLSRLKNFFDESRQKREQKEKDADQKLKDSIKKNGDSIAAANEALEANQDALIRLSQMKVQHNNSQIASLGTGVTKTNQAEHAKQNAIKKPGSIEQLLSLIDNVTKPLALHISTNQLYQEQALSIEKSLFDIRVCDAPWIHQLKQIHNLLVQTKEMLFAYQKKYINSFEVVDSLLMLFSRVGNILDGMNVLEPHMQQNWFQPLNELFSVARNLSLAAADERKPAVLEQREPNAAASINANIKQDIKELLVELPSNLPSRALLDKDLTALFGMVNQLLDVNSAFDLSKKGLELYNSDEFKRLMDLISKINAVVGSDFVYEKLSSYRARLTKQLSAGMQRILAEEINMGYKAGVITKGLYQQAEVLADYGLINITTLYAKQLSCLHAQQNLDAAVKGHFVAYIENFLKVYASKQQDKWVTRKNALQTRIDCIKTEIEKIHRQNNGSWILIGKDLVTAQQGLELEKAQINRLIIAKNRYIEFLKRYAAAPYEARAALADQYTTQEKMRMTLNGIMRQLTMVKWDIYYYEFKEAFKDNVDTINHLINRLEKYIETLATAKSSIEQIEQLSSLIAEIKAVNQRLLPPAMQRLFTLALQTIEKDLALLPPAADERSNVASTAQSSPVISRENVSSSQLTSEDPHSALMQYLMGYARAEAQRLDVKDEWYKRHIIEHLEIFTEMWAPEKEKDPRVIKRRNDILTSLQAENAPNYSFLSHPADVKIVYLLTIAGEHGLGFHKTIFSLDNMTEASQQFRTDARLQAKVVALPKKTDGETVSPEVSTLSKKENHETVSEEDIEKAITSYQGPHSLCAFFRSVRGQGQEVLTDTNISYLKRVARDYCNDKNPKGKQKLLAIYNALVDKNFKALSEAVFLQTGFFSSAAESKGRFKRPSHLNPQNSQQQACTRRHSVLW